MMTPRPLSRSLSSPPDSPGETGVLGSIVCEKTARICGRHYPDRLRAVMLTGSLARNEATWVTWSEGWKLLGDVEFLLVFEPRSPLPPQPALRSLEQEIQAELGSERIAGHIQLTPVHPRFFAELDRRIFAYELRARGRVVYGDGSVVRLIPELSAADILWEDAWRLLANRVIENLEAAAEVKSCDGPLPPGLRYRTVKLYLDMATSLSVFAGFYAPAYLERCHRLTALAGTPEAGQNWPFPPGPFSEQVSIATDAKLGGDPPAATLDWEFWRQAVQHARSLWQWELARLAGTQDPVPGEDPLRRWIRRQPLAERLRGWIFVWRACGWLRGSRRWLGWARLISNGSPRYCVYQAARTLLDELPGAIENHPERGVAPATRDRVLSHLPVVQGVGPRSAWRWGDLVGEVAWNYHQFLEPTRA